MDKPLILTLGDPVGIGPEILLNAIRHADAGLIRRPLVVAGDPGVLQQAGNYVGATVQVTESTDLPLATHRLVVDGRPVGLQALSSLPAHHLRTGQSTEASARAMMAYIEWASDRCLDGSAAGLVTCPISKAAALKAGYDIPGHTEFLAERCGTERVVMMLVGPRLRVCLVTTHLALEDVPRALSVDSIAATLAITDAALQRDFGLEKPRLAVLALNPHAGEAGKFGDQEIRLIAPAIAQARKAGIAADGPHSADSLFHQVLTRGSHDAVICMYHDQGLIPLKLLHFDDGVNVTLGLPIIRTSVDHGTAYSLAGTGTASCTSLLAAINTAEVMAEHRAAGG